MRPLLSSSLLLLLAVCCCGPASGSIFDGVKKTLTGGGSEEPQTGVDFKMGSDGARIGVKTDDGNPFYYVECGAGVSSDGGFGAGCERKWKPLFYACIAGGGVLAALLLSCCCCCCCAPCRKRRAAAYYPAMQQSSSVILVQAEAPNPMSNPPPQPPSYDVPMLRA